MTQRPVTLVTLPGLPFPSLTLITAISIPPTTLHLTPVARHSPRLELLGATVIASLPMVRSAIWNPLAWACKKSMPVYPSHLCLSSSLPSRAPFIAAPLCSTAQSTSHASDLEESGKRRSIYFEEIKAKQEVTARLADRYSRGYARFYFVPGKVSENQDFIRLYACLAWKIDAFLDDFPEWKTAFLGPEAGGCLSCHALRA